MKIAIYFSEKLIPFLFRLYNDVKFKAVKKNGINEVQDGFRLSGER
jgi:hypothetical protein